MPATLPRPAARRLALPFALSLAAACDATLDHPADHAAPGAAPPPPALVAPTARAGSVLLRNADGQNQAMAAVGRLVGAACTAALVDVGGHPDAPAQVLTAGHCVLAHGAESASHVAVDLQPDDLRVRFNDFVDTQGAVVEHPVAAIRYASMRGVDLAVLELEATVGQLTAAGVAPLPLAAAPPGDSAAIRVVGIPQVDPEFVRRVDCQAGGRATIVEWIWHWFDVHATDCQDIRPGSSGSPALTTAGEVFGVVHTTSIDAIGRSCWRGAPCEVWPEGTALVEDTTYAIPLDGLAACFGEVGRLDLGRPGCPLPTPDRLTLASVPPTPTRPGNDDPPRPIGWGVRAEGADYLHYKLGPAGRTDCRAATGYGAPIPLDQQALADLPLPTDEGVHWMCLRGGPRPAVDGGWDPLTDPAVAVVEIDLTGPTRAPRWYEDALGIHLVFEPPELSRFRHKRVAPGAACGEGGYAEYNRVAISIPPEERPTTLCVRAADAAGNWGRTHPLAIE